MKSSTLRKISGHELKFFYSGEHLKQDHWKQLYALLIKVIKSDGLAAGIEILNSLGLQDCPLTSILEGGLPFIDVKFFEKAQESRNGLKALKKYKLLDFMKNSEFQALSETGGLAGEARSLGNSNWLLWQRTLYQALGQSDDHKEKILFGYLCSDFVFSSKELSDEENDVTSEFDITILELFRVSYPLFFSKKLNF